MRGNIDVYHRIGNDEAHMGDDLMLAIARGSIPGISVVNKFGANPIVTNGNTEDIWDGSNLYTFPTTADITHISQAADQAALRGGTIQVQGLDANWDLVVQTQDLNAANTSTAVALTTPLIRVFRMKVLENVVSTQTIKAHNVGDTIDYAQIINGNNQTLMAIYTVPNGKTAIMTNYYCDYVRDSVKDPDAIEYSMFFIDRANDYAPQIKHRKGIPKQASGFQHNFKPYYKVTQKTDIVIRANPNGANAHVHAGFDLILIDN